MQSVPLNFYLPKWQMQLLKAARVRMLLPPLLECAVWALGLSLCSMASEMFGLTQLTAVLKSAHAVVKTLIGVLAVCGLFLIVSTTIVTMAAARAV